VSSLLIIIPTLFFRTHARSSSRTTASITRGQLYDYNDQTVRDLQVFIGMPGLAQWELSVQHTENLPGYVLDWWLDVTTENCLEEPRTYPITPFRFRFVLRLCCSLR
jgi:hypothetical protein